MLKIHTLTHSLTQYMYTWRNNSKSREADRERREKKNNKIIIILIMMNMIISLTSTSNVRHVCPEWILDK